MSTADILKAAEADVAALIALPGEIRSKVKAGLVELTAIRDEIDAIISTETAKARDALGKLKAVVADAGASAAPKP